MNVYLSFDVEVWCNNWAELDQRFPASFERYVYGRSPRGNYALPATLDILQRHGLRGVFFVEPLFSLRFGAQHLACIVGMIRDAGQDVQLHLHPEWTDEIRPALLDDVSRKRQHLTYYTLDEQTRLIAHGKRALEAAGSGPITAFRAGSYAANRHTFEALRRNGILLDSSLNELADVSGRDLPPRAGFATWHRVGDVEEFPVTVFTDGLGKLRPAQVSACGFAEMRDALRSAHDAGCAHFVIVSHNFELLRPGESRPDDIMVQRFENLCAYLASDPARYTVTSYQPQAAAPRAEDRPRARRLATATRWLEQLRRRLP